MLTVCASVLTHSIPSWPPVRLVPHLPHFPDGETEAERGTVNCSRLPQGNNGADLSTSNAELSTIVPSSLLHGWGVLSPCPQASPGCSSTQSAFVETAQKSGTPLPTGYLAHSPRKPTARMLQTHVTAGNTAVQKVAPSQPARAGQGCEEWALWPRWAWHGAPSHPLAP